MPTDESRRVAADWLVREGNGFWTWDDAGRVLLWQDGRTVVFREELVLILENLPDPMLPNPGLAVLVLAACRGLVPDEKDLRTLVPPSPDAGLRQQDLLVCLEATGHLNEIAALPEPLRRTPASKALLLVLAGSVSQGAAKDDVLALLREGLPKEAWPQTPKMRELWRPALREVREAFAGLTPGAIEQAARTGLTEVPAAAEVEIPLGQRVRHLLKDLEEDAEFSALAALTREVMAALMMPRALPRLDYETPGGFSDIGNRGPLHRLLISELAHDDDTLAARIALNEALYLRREPAALPPPTALAVVADSGVRMWGVPRVLASAVALAALAKGDQYAESATFRATAGGVEPIRLDTREGLTAHLEALETPIHPAAALTALREKYADRPGQLDVLLITHPHCLEEPALAEALAALPAGTCHAATVDREGNFTLQLHTALAWSSLTTARLKLDDLFASKTKKPAGPQLAERTKPAFFYEREAPLLLPVNTNFRAVFQREQAPAFFGYSDDGDLWTWHIRTEGARRLSVVAMRGSFCGIVCSPATGRFTAVTYDTAPRTLSLISWTGPATDDESISRSTIPRFDAPPEHLFPFGEMLLIGTRTEVFAVDPQGKILGQAKIPTGYGWIGSRFLVRPGDVQPNYVSVVFDGRSLVFLPLPHQYLHARQPLLQIFEPAHDGQFVALFPDGRLVNAESGELLVSAPKKVNSFQTLPDGYHVMIDSGSVEKSLVNLKTKTKASQPAHVPMRNLPHLPPRSWSVRSKFTHVALTPAGRLRLRAQKGYWVEIQNTPGTGCLALRRLDRHDEGTLPGLAFVKAEQHPEFGTSLCPVEWADGSRAWLDERGLVHLQSADLEIPEISILLAESTSLPAWTSNGIKIGPAFFTGQPETKPSRGAEIDTLIQRFAAHCR